MGLRLLLVVLLAVGALSEEECPDVMYVKVILSPPAGMKCEPNDGMKWVKAQLNESRVWRGASREFLTPPMKFTLADLNALTEEWSNHLAHYLDLNATSRSKGDITTKLENNTFVEFDLTSKIKHKDFALLTTYLHASTEKNDKLRKKFKMLKRIGRGVSFIRKLMTKGGAFIKKLFNDKAHDVDFSKNLLATQAEADKCVAGKKEGQEREQAAVACAGEQLKTTKTPILTSGILTSDDEEKLEEVAAEVQKTELAAENITPGIKTTVRSCSKAKECSMCHQSRESRWYKRGGPKDCKWDAGKCKRKAKGDTSEPVPSDCPSAFIEMAEQLQVHVDRMGEDAVVDASLHALRQLHGREHGLKLEQKLGHGVYQHYNRFTESLSGITDSIGRFIRFLVASIATVVVFLPMMAAFYALQGFILIAFCTLDFTLGSAIKFVGAIADGGEDPPQYMGGCASTLEFARDIHNGMLRGMWAEKIEPLFQWEFIGY